MANPAYELSYADIPFLQPTAEVEAVIASRIPFSQLREYLPPTREWVGKNMAGVAFAKPPDEPLVVLNQWHYPTGAARWSVFHGIVTSSMMDDMKQAAIPADTSELTPQEFIIRTDGLFQQGINVADGTGTTHTAVTTDLYMLPPRPISPPVPPVDEDDEGVVETLWLITLVDERYYLQFADGGAITCRDSNSDSWEHLLDYLADQLGITLAYDAIEAVYGTPAEDSALFSNFENAAVLLDACAYNLGRVVVRNFDGTYTLIRYDDALLNMKNQRPLSGKAGGRAVVAGGMVLDEDLGVYDQARKAVLPYSVVVTFPKCGNDGKYIDSSKRVWIKNSYGAVYSKEVNGNDLVLVHNSMGSFAFSWRQTIHDTSRAFYENTTGTGDPTNQTDLDDLATQLAKDFYWSQLASLDEVYPGVLAWQPEGAADIIWTFRPDRPTTRVQRKPYSWSVPEMQHETNADISAEEDENCTPIVTDVTCVNGQLVVTKKYLTGDFTVSDKPCLGPPIGPGLGGGGIDPIKPPIGIDPIKPPIGIDPVKPGDGGILPGGGGTGVSCLQSVQDTCSTYLLIYSPAWIACVNTLYIAKCLGGPIDPNPAGGRIIGSPRLGGVQSVGSIGPLIGPTLGGGPPNLIDIGELEAALTILGITAGLTLSASTAVLAQTAIGNVVTYTPAADGTYQVGAILTVTAYTLGSISLQLDWTDDRGATHTAAIGVGFGGVGSTNEPPQVIRAKSGTAITVSTVAGFGFTGTFNASGSIVYMGS